ncbi:MAG: DUF4261 domain-containing protein [Pirellulales bacterium]|nr:DUF4261 domain-containing protein [Pirellulales bacterium]
MDNPLRWLALVLLDAPRLVDFEVLAEYLGQQFAEIPPVRLASKTDNLLTFSVGDHTAAITLVPQPVPWSRLEGPCATAWYWPEAERELNSHQAHLLITVVDEGCKPVATSTLLTQLVAGAAATSASRGVFWGPGRLVHPPQAFIEQALQLSEDDLPLFAWVDFRVEEIRPRSLRLYTTGLGALGFPELEIADFQGEAQHLLEYAYNIAHYQVAQSKTINEGDTLGLTDQLQAVAHRKSSMFNDEMEVIALDIQSAGE